MRASAADLLLQPEFEYAQTTARIVFGPNSMEKIAEALEWVGAGKPLILCTTFQSGDAERVADLLNGKSAGIYANATMHTPTDVTDEALAIYQRLGADCTIAIGGGSTTGLGKALSHRTGCKQIVIPTTYAGSEVTPVLGQTENGRKVTFTDPAILPDVVLYDPLLTYGLPVTMSLTSAFNALAHALEGLYAKNRNPISSMMAQEGAKAIIAALPLIKADPANARGRELALYGAWLCGTVLGNVGMALHHKLCHVLGGGFDLPHAETHAVILPHSMAFNAPAARGQFAPVAQVLPTGALGRDLFDLATSLAMPTSLQALGMPEDGIERAADEAMKNAYWNPRKFDRDQIRQLIENAYFGRSPEEMA